MTLGRIYLRALQIQVKKGIGSSVLVLNREGSKMMHRPSEGGGPREIESVFNLRLMPNASIWGWIASLGHRSASGRWSQV